jgi:tRNA(Ile)-lysidine synthase TilS/MesJ
MQRDYKRFVPLGIAQPLPLLVMHIDHILSGKRGANELSNVRTLCRMHHVLHVVGRHRGLIPKALADDIIPPN